MDIDLATPLLGGLSPSQFMRRHWQKAPRLVRASGIAETIGRDALFALAADDTVASRLVERDDGGWAVRHGPFARRHLPGRQRPGWTLLVQGVDRHLVAAQSLLARFRFVPDARLDDVMVSYASDGGGVGPHLDSYDVFLVQVAGQRRWRVSRPASAAERALVPGLPLKILADFRPGDDWLLGPGDLLYVPPGWAHDGTAVGADCITCSVGFRAPTRAEAAQAVLSRLLDAPAPGGGVRYRDPALGATTMPAAIPAALSAFAADAVRRWAGDPQALDAAIGAWLSEPPDDVWFDAPDAHDAAGDPGAAVRLAPRSRLLYDARCVHINGTSLAVAGRDAAILRRLADARWLPAGALLRCSARVRAETAGWVAAGWLDVLPGDCIAAVGGPPSD